MLEESEVSDKQITLGDLMSIRKDIFTLSSSSLFSNDRTSVSSMLGNGGRVARRLNLTKTLLHLSRSVSLLSTLW